MAPKKRAKIKTTRAKRPTPRNEETPIQVEGETKLPSKRKLLELARQYEHSKQTTAELGGRMGSAIRTMADNDGLHPGAFRRAMKELKMEPGRLNDELAHLHYYRDVLGVTARAASAPRLPMGDEIGDETETGDESSNIIDGAGSDQDETEQENVHQLPFAAAGG
jgi:hypothetical protein